MSEGVCYIMEENPRQPDNSASSTQISEPDKKNAETLAEKSKKKSKRHKQKIGVYYSFLTFVLLLVILQVGIGAVLNISKTIAYKGKINTMERVRSEAEQRNKDLKSDIKLFSKTSSLEEIARNNLKMAGDKEVLVIINNIQPQPQVQPVKHKFQKSRHKK